MEPEIRAEIVRSGKELGIKSFYVKGYLLGGTWSRAVVASFMGSGEPNWGRMPEGCLRIHSVSIPTSFETDGQQKGYLILPIRRRCQVLCGRGR